MGQAKLKGRTREARASAALSAFGARALTPERFNAFVAWTRSPAIGVIGEEIEHFSTLDEHVLGVIVRDRQDNDYGYVVLARDQKGRFRAISVHCGERVSAARSGLLAELNKHSTARTTIVPQGDENDDDSGVDLFSPAVLPDKINPAFDLVRQSDFCIPGRSIMSEMMRHFVDVDGNFVEQFQTTGFDSRIWELYLYAALLEQGLYVSKPKPAPDFQVSDGERKVFVEAVTVNATAGEGAQSPYDAPPERSLDEIIRLSQTKIPIKYGSALWSKLKRKRPYWTLPDVAGHPLVFAIADFHEKQSMMWTSTALTTYLYGVSHDFTRDANGELIISPLQIETHEYEGKVIPSGFFQQAEAEHVSAVLFSASGTLSKFNRMGRLAGFGRPDQVMIRMGYKHRHDPNASLPEPFRLVIEPGKTKETWAEGLSMFHNPNALHPVDPGMFPNVAHHFMRKRTLESWLPKFFPYASYTHNFLTDDEPRSASG